MKRFRVLNVILIALIALAIWRTVDVWRRTAPEIPDHADAPAPTPDPASVPVRKPAVMQLVAAITDKDLFDVSRQAPSAATAPVPDQTPQPPPTLKLSGVIAVGDYREAVFIDINQNNKQIRMREGEEISGYKITEIKPLQVSLVNGTGDNVKLDLVLDTSKAPPGKAAGPAGVAAPPRPGIRPPGKQVAGAPNAAGGFGPPGGAAPSAMQHNDARDRAQRARDRLKRLRDEAASNR